MRIQGQTPRAAYSKHIGNCSDQLPRYEGRATADPGCPESAVPLGCLCSSFTPLPTAPLKSQVKPCLKFLPILIRQSRVTEDNGCIRKPDQAQTAFLFLVESDVDCAITVSERGTIASGLSNPAFGQLCQGSEKYRVAYAHFTLHFHYRSGSHHLYGKTYPPATGGQIARVSPVLNTWVDRCRTSR